MRTLGISIAILGSTTAYAEPCANDADPRSCREHAPTLSIEPGAFFHRFTEDPSAYGVAARTTMPTTTPLTAIGARFRLLFAFGALYVGGEMDVGDAYGGPQLAYNDPHTPGAAPLIAHQDYAAGAVVLGVRKRFDRVSIGGELAAGGRSVAYNWIDRDGSTVTSTFAINHYELDASVRADWWVHPMITVGASIGTGLLGPGDELFELGVAMHFRAFDGMR